MTSASASSPDDLFAAALDRYRAGKPAEAAKLFDAVLDLLPDHGDALRLYGLSLARAGRAAEGLPFLARARRLAPDNPLAHLHHGVGLLEAGRPARAAAVLRRAAAMLPADPVPWINLSTAILDLGRPAAARAAARRAIALAPHSADAHCALGHAERKAGNPGGARAAFGQATALAPSFADAWIGLGLACFQLGQVGQATGAMECALKADPRSRAAEANLAGFLLLQGEYDGSVQRLHDLLARDPGCLAARLNLANALLLDRDGSAALDVLDWPAPSGREGAHWHAHRAMALLVLGHDALARAELDRIPQPFGDAEILIVWRRLALAERAGEAAEADGLAERLAALAADETASLLEHRIASRFDLAGFCSRKHAPDQAMEHWIAGHRLLSRLQPFSREGFAGFVDASIAAFGADRLAHGPRARATATMPVFVVGLPRSGTSLMEQILAAHARVHGAGERPALNRMAAELAGPPLEPASVARLAALDEGRLTAAAERYVAELGGLAPDKAYVVDKMPGNALHLGFLATLLPGARVIWCRRDPRDIGLSIFQLRFFGYHPYAHDLGDLGWYMRQHERLMAHWRAVLPNPMLEVQLADWVGDFDSTLARVLDFLALEHDPACAQFYQQRRRMKTASAQQVRQPINARGLGRWRSWERHLGPMIAELEADSRSISS